MGAVGARGGGGVWGVCGRVVMSGLGLALAPRRMALGVELV